ncbi:MAG: hypothetical protein GTO18_19520 [Anaerolineales bacterium]|nr:hypothetical protein [Anaerolineales bacterium]
MRNIYKLLLVSCFGLLFTACSDLESQDEGLIEPTSVLPSPTVSEVVSSSSVTSTPTTSQTPVPRPEGEPATEWNGIPIPSEASAADAVYEDGREVEYLFITLMTAEGIRDYYARVMLRDGWGIILEEFDEINGLVIVFEKGKTMVSVNVLPGSQDGDETYVILGLIP